MFSSCLCCSVVSRIHGRISRQAGVDVDHQLVLDARVEQLEADRVEEDD